MSTHLQPAYLALTSPPDGKYPPFLLGLATHPCLIVSTGIWLLTTHTFTGEYSARFRPTSNNPHHCKCGEPLQMAHHVLTSCPCYTVARSQYILPLTCSVSLSHVFGMKEGRVALGAFLAASQTCVRPHQTEQTPEELELEDFG
jgi:hypothetical protein